MLLQVLISGLVIGSVYGLIALGYSLIYKASGLMSFMQGDLLTVGAFLGWFCYGVLHIPFIISLILVVVAVFFMGFAMEKGVISRLVAKGTLPIYTVLATIAISYIIQNACMIIFGADTKAYPTIFETAYVDLFGRSFQTEQIVCIAASLLLTVAFSIFMNKTSLGTAMRASAMDAMAARACGIDTGMATGLSWAIAAGVAAFAGMLLGPIYTVYTTLGAVIGRKGFSSAVIGGFGNMTGAIVGGLLLGVVETMISVYVSSAYKDLIAYSLLLFFLFVKPTGLFNERAIAD